MVLSFETKSLEMILIVLNLCENMDGRVGILKRGYQLPFRWLFIVGVDIETPKTILNKAVSNSAYIFIRYSLKCEDQS